MNDFDNRVFGQTGFSQRFDTNRWEGIVDFEEGVDTFRFTAPMGFDDDVAQHVVAGGGDTGFTPIDPDVAEIDLAADGFALMEDAFLL